MALAPLDQARRSTRRTVDAAKRAVGDLPGAARVMVIAVGTIVAFFVAGAILPNGLPFGVVVTGLVFGSLYALTAVGIVLIYRANRVVNFAQAEFGGVAAVLAIQFKLQLNWNYFLAIGAGLIIALVLGAAIELLVIRRFREAPRLILSVATIGLAQILTGIAILIPILWSGAFSGSFSTPWDFGFRVDPVRFRGDHVLAMIVVPVVMAALIAFLRFTDYGVVIRAASENSDRASLLGVPVGRLSTMVWSIAALLSALAVLLRIPILGFTSFISVSGGGPSLLLRTLAAAVIGRMESLPRTVVAAVGIGVFQQAADWQLGRTTIVDALLVVVILGALLAQRDFFSRTAETGISSWRAIKEVRPIPSELRNLPEVRWAFRGLRVVLLGIGVSLPLWASPSQEAAAALVLIYAMLAASLLMLTGWAGHISLGQFALAGFGGAATAVLYGRHNWDITLAITGGVVVAAGVALVIGLPALRIKGPFLAVTTLAFAVTSSTYFLEDRYFPWFIEPRIPRPTLFQRLPLETDWQMYLFALGALLLVLTVTRNLRRSHIGRALIAVRDNEIASQSVTLDSTRLKLLAFVISGGVAGFAGAIYVIQQNGLHTDAYGAEVSLRLFSMVVIGGLGSLPGVILGAIYVRGAEFFLPPGWTLIASGTGILLLLMFLPQGLGGLIYSIRDSFLRSVARRRGILVPSLLADKRVEDQQAPVAIGAALEGLGVKPRIGSSDPQRAERPDHDDHVPEAAGSGSKR